MALSPGGPLEEAEEEDQPSETTSKSSSAVGAGLPSKAPVERLLVSGAV